MAARVCGALGRQLAGSSAAKLAPAVRIRVGCRAGHASCSIGAPGTGGEEWTRSHMLHALAALTLLLTAADHWTTWLCLRSPVPGWQVFEANPLADWLFQGVGLVPGLLIDSVVTLLALGLLIVTPLVPRPAKNGFLAVVVVWTGWAVVNNVQAILALGISPLAGA
jgi:hypothetical protein